MPDSDLFYLPPDYGHPVLAHKTLRCGTHLIPTLSETPNREMSFVGEQTHRENKE